VEVELNNQKATIFQAVQDLVQASHIGTKQEKLRRIWSEQKLFLSNLLK
jgi:hypothetical protein